MVVTTFLWFSVVCYGRFVNIVIGIQFWFRHSQSIETVRHIDRILKALPRFPSPYRFSLSTPAFDTATNCQCHIKTLQYYCIMYTIHRSRRTYSILLVSRFECEADQVTVVQTVSHFVIALYVDQIDSITPDKTNVVESNGSVNKPFANNL